MRADISGNELGSSDLVVEMEQEEEEEEEKDNLSALKEEEVVEVKEDGSDGEDVQVSVKKKPFSRTTASSTKSVETADQTIEIKQDIKQEKSGKHDLNGTKVLPKEKKMKRQPLRK